MSMNGSWRGAEGEGERESQAAPPSHVGLEPTNHEIMTRAETKSQTLNQLSHPVAPLEIQTFSSSRYMEISLQMEISLVNVNISYKRETSQFSQLYLCLQFLKK